MGRTVSASMQLPTLTREVLEEKERTAGLSDDANLVVMALQKVQKERNIRPVLSPQQLRMLVDRATATSMTLMRPVNDHYQESLISLEQIGQRHGIFLDPTREAVHHLCAHLSGMPRVMGPVERKESQRFRSQKNERIRKKWFRQRDLKGQQKMIQAVLKENPGVPRHRVIRALENTIRDFQTLNGERFRKIRGARPRRL